MTDNNNPQAVEGAGHEAATPVAVPADSPKDGEDTDSLLDVFKSVEVQDSIVSVLSRGLADVSIYSLLEQTQQVANEIKWGR